MPYYYECKIGLFNRLMGAFYHWMLFKILDNVVKKSKVKIGSKEYGKLIYE
jgi:hypothetical protein